MKKRIGIYFFLFFIVALWQTQAAEFNGWCVKVLEGDSIVVYVNKKMLNVRLANVDCPDRGQPFEKQATEFTSALILKKKICVTIDSYAGSIFLVGRILIDGKDLSMLLIEAGLAWYYKLHGSDRYLSQAYKKTKRKKIGIWSEENPVPPWVFRGEKEKVPDDSD